MLDAFRIHEARATTPPEPENFIGRVRMQNLAKQTGAAGLELLAVFFDPGARTRPHIHPTDQVLYFIRGDGLVAFPGEEEQLVREGELVAIPAGALHMHGAREGSPVCHIALRAPGETDWHPQVPDEWRRFVLAG